MYQSKYVLRKDYLFVYDANHILADLVNAKRVREREQKREREREREKMAKMQTIFNWLKFKSALIKLLLSVDLKNILKQLF